MTTTFTMKSSAFRDLVAPVIPFAATDPYLVAINSVHIESADGHLIATTTDRFRLALCRRPVDVPDGLSFGVRVADLKQILTVFRTTKLRDSELTITVDDTTLTVSVDAWGEYPAATFTYGLPTFDFPNVKGLFAGLVAAPVEPGPVGLNAEYLADFRHAVGKHDPINVRFINPSKPVVVTAGDHFLGAIMPVRIDDVGAKVPVVPVAWTGYLGLPKATKLVSV